MSSNPYWRNENFISDLDKKYAKMDFTTRKNQHEQLYVHLVAHTHDDVGWLKTVDQYYSGSDEADQEAEVNLVLSTVVEELIKHPWRKFTYVEMKFFTMWYYEQDQEVKDQVRMLIKEGRLEFVNGGWSMHDEACPHFEDMINNMMLGHQFLMKEFGVKPRIGWHIDPFGHSNANPRLFADMGFEAWLFARLDHADRDERLEDKSMNFLWRPFAKHFGNQKEIFTGVMRDHYCWPQGFWYDERFPNDEPFVTNERLDTFNAKAKTLTFQKYLNEMASNYLGNQMLVPFGCDFTYANARMNFDQMDKLIKYFNEHNTANITLMYSTPGAYIDSLHKQNLTWPVKYDDMFPYSDNPQDYWAGYFTSRQAAKKQVRDGQTNLHASNYLYAKRVIQEDVKKEEIEKIEEAKFAMLDWMGVYQHHDAVAGTAKQHVADNYVKHLSGSMWQNNALYSYLLDVQMYKDLGQKLKLQGTFFNGVQNDTVAETPMGTYLKDEKEVLVVVHNPSGKVNKQFVEIQVPDSSYSVQAWCPHSKKFYDITAKTSFMRQFHRNNDGTNTTDYKIVLPYYLAPNQVGYIKLEKMCAEEVAEREKVEVNPEKKSNVSLEFIDTGAAPLKFRFKKSFISKKDNSSQTLDQTFGVNVGFYAASNGSDNYEDGCNSPGGAYLFKPARDQEYQFQYAQRGVKLIDK